MTMGVVIDAMDALSPKCGLIAEAVNRKLPVVTVGGCAGRLDGTRIKVTDLRDSRDDPLMMLVRKRLRQNFDFPRGKAPFGVSCVWSDEPFTQPTDCEGLPGGEIPEDEDLRPVAAVAGLDVELAGGQFEFLVAATVLKRVEVAVVVEHQDRHGGDFVEDGFHFAGQQFASGADEGPVLAHAAAPERRRCQACRPLMISSNTNEMPSITVATAVAPA